ncbi:hypothetical protein LSTR_LSTR009971, partial [Laodelphax striatellus]
DTMYWASDPLFLWRRSKASEDATGMSHASSKATTVCSTASTGTSHNSGNSANSGSGNTAAPTTATTKEVRYPFGVQNDLGQVILSNKLKAKDGTVGASSSSSSFASAVPSQPAAVASAHAHTHAHQPRSSTLNANANARLSPSRLSLQSASLQCSIGSSADLSCEAALLERAIRYNDTLRVKRFLNLHHDKFQVNLHGSLLGKSSSCETQSQDVEILLRKSKTLIDRLGPGGSYHSDDSDSSSSSSGAASRRGGPAPLIFSNALHVAVEQGSVEVARLLLKYGLEPNQGGRLPCLHPPPPPHTHHGFFAASTSAVTTASTTTTTTTAVQATSSCYTTSVTEPISSSSTATAATTVTRRVSWVPPTSPTTAALDLAAKKRRGLTAKAAAVARQRSFSLESNSDLLRPCGAASSWQQERRSVSLKSSPLISTRTPPIEEAAREKPIPERSIIAELRRSSEIFKSILLNLSMKESEQSDGDETKSNTDISPKDPQVDVATLLAEHGRRRLASFESDGFSSLSSTSSSSSSSSPSSSSSRCSESSLGSPEEDDDLDGAPPPGGEASPLKPLLKTHPNLPAEKLVGIAGVYTRRHLFTLPALFMAVVKGNATLVYLLLKYGANANFQRKLSSDKHCPLLVCCRPPYTGVISVETELCVGVGCHVCEIPEVDLRLLLLLARQEKWNGHCTIAGKEPQRRNDFPVEGTACISGRAYLSDYGIPVSKENIRCFCHCTDALL